MELENSQGPPGIAGSHQKQDKAWPLPLQSSLGTDPATPGSQTSSLQNTRQEISAVLGH